MFFFDTNRSTALANKFYFQNKDGLNRFTLYTAPTNLLPGFEASVAAPLCSGCGSFPFLSERERVQLLRSLCWCARASRYAISAPYRSADLKFHRLIPGSCLPGRRSSRQKTIESCPSPHARQRVLNVISRSPDLAHLTPDKRRGV